MKKASSPDGSHASLLSDESSRSDEAEVTILGNDDMQLTGIIPHCSDRFYDQDSEEPKESTHPDEGFEITMVGDDDMQLTGVISQISHQDDEEPRESAHSHEALEATMVGNDDMQLTGIIPSYRSDRFYQDEEEETGKPSLEKLLANSFDNSISTPRIASKSSSPFLNVQNILNISNQSGHLLNLSNFDDNLSLEYSRSSSHFPTESTMHGDHLLSNLKVPSDQPSSRNSSFNVEDPTESSEESINLSSEGFIEEENTGHIALQMLRRQPIPSDSPTQTINLKSIMEEAKRAVALENSFNSSRQDISFINESNANNTMIGEDSVMSLREFLMQVEISFLDPSLNRKPSLGTRISLSSQAKNVSEVLQRACLANQEFQYYSAGTENLQNINAGVNGNIINLENGINQNNPQIFLKAREDEQFLNELKHQLRDLKTKCRSEAKATFYEWIAEIGRGMHGELCNILSLLENDDQKIHAYNNRLDELLQSIELEKRQFEIKKGPATPSRLLVRTPTKSAPNTPISPFSSQKKRRVASASVQLEDQEEQEDIYEILSKISGVSSIEVSEDQISFCLKGQFRLELSLGEHISNGDQNRYFSGKSFQMVSESSMYGFPKNETLHEIAMGLLSSANLPAIFDKMRHTGQLPEAINDSIIRLDRIQNLLNEIKLIDVEFPVRPSVEVQDSSPISFSSYAVDVEFSSLRKGGKFNITFELNSSCPFSSPLHLIKGYTHITGNRLVSYQAIEEIALQTSSHTDFSPFNYLSRFCFGIENSLL
eukprot:TRINITY_DN5557_c0_g1_i6.p1 TRINITY_DN5557_c0_g1~~TRINITY_DN5557_c0_g1_i6.p1  ORF type:complete len:771 (+),score=171.68 TRINITY_DN5557_c0_g1_i6:182-2494(+)